MKGAKNTRKRTEKTKSGEGQGQGEEVKSAPEESLCKDRKQVNNEQEIRKTPGGRQSLTQFHRMSIPSGHHIILSALTYSEPTLDMPQDRFWHRGAWSSFCSIICLHCACDTKRVNQTRGTLKLHVF